MLPVNLALVSEVPDVDISELTRVAAALQKQITRDFTPMWSVPAGIAAFSSVQDVPIDYWMISLCFSVPEGAGGHRDADGRPAAFVEWQDDWSLSASHEMLEMLADPWGNRLIAGPSLKPDQGRVEYLVEIADPCQSIDCAYTINGELVSDFYSPHFFDPVASEGVRYSFSGKITQPRQVLRGGYLSWRDPATTRWWQAQWYKGSNAVFVDCGEMAPDMSFRAQIDRRPKPKAKTNARGLTRLRKSANDAQAAARQRAQRFSAHLKSAAHAKRE
jgi:hypothetical protein